MYVYTYLRVCMNACLKVSVLDTFLNYFLPYILREGFSLNLELPDSAILGGRKFWWSTCLCLPPRTWDCTYAPSYLGVYAGVGEPNLG